MKVSAVLPFDVVTPGEFLTQDAIVEVAQAAERAGFEGGAVTDHPCPTGRWLDAGGHHAQDPFVMLALVGAATRTLKLHTSIIVVPYRNPFIMARSISTLDVCTGGRTVLGLGAGYLKGEYFAVGADFENRNDLTDEYIAAMKAAWSGEEFSFEGSGYQARGARILPLPLQRPHPPIWVGGNSRRAIRRAVRHGDYWSPFHSGSGPVAATARTKAIADEGDLAGLIAYLREQIEVQGRTRPLPIALDSMKAQGAGWSPQAILDMIGELEAMGVSWVTVHVEGRSRREWCDNAQRWGEEVITRVKSPEAA